MNNLNLTNNITNSKPRILTGDRPTGKLHLGHFVGSLQNRVKLQDEYDTFIMVADVQALTDNYDNPEKIRTNVLEVTLDNLSVGIDPTKSTIFIQSEIPQIAELTVFFMNLVKHNEVLRNPTVKTELEQKNFKGGAPFGFIAYPVSQAADIHFLRSDAVPAGEDQAPMIELANLIGRRFNQIYKREIFHPVKGIYSKNARLIGTDGNAKMSKSLGNTIYLSDSKEEVLQKVKKMYTDPNRVRPTDPGKVEGNPVFVYHDAFNTNVEEVKDLKNRYQKGQVGDVEVKEKLANSINTFLEPFREKRAYYENHIKEVHDILNAGKVAALQEGNKTMEMVRDVMKINY